HYYSVRQMMLGLFNILIYVMIILEKMLRMSKAKNGGYTVPKPTPSMEDYIELIYNLIQTKGYARVTDLAETLEVHPSSVTKMIHQELKHLKLCMRNYKFIHINV